MSDPDELFTLKNQFWVGNYQNAISEGSLLSHLDASLRTERDVYVYRAQLALGLAADVVASIPDSPSTPIALNAVKLLAMYQSGGDREMIELTLKQWLNDTSNSNPHLLLIAGMVFAQENKLSDALSALNQGQSLEHMMYMVHLYCSMDRVDLARKQVAEMKKIEEDATPTTLAQAWVLTLEGGDQADEATLHFQELSDRFGGTALLLNGAAVAFMAMGNFVEAERLLVEAVQKDARSEDALVNLIAASAHLNKPFQQYAVQLQQLAPGNAFLNEFIKADQEFGSMAAAFS